MNISYAHNITNNDISFSPKTYLQPVYSMERLIIKLIWTVPRLQLWIR